MSDPTQEQAAAQAPQAPAFSVVAGDPTEEELAALVLVLAAASGGEEPAPEPSPSRWSHPGARLGVTSRASSWAWRTAGAR